jgi:hypothetical protein
MPAGTVAGEMESRLRKAARKKGLKGRSADSYVYGTMNNAGTMRGNQVTAKGMREYAASRRVGGY